MQACLKDAYCSCAHSPSRTTWMGGRPGPLPPPGCRARSASRRRSVRIAANSSSSRYRQRSASVSSACRSGAAPPASAAASLAHSAAGGKSCGTAAATTGSYSSGSWALQARRGSQSRISVLMGCWAACAVCKQSDHSLQCTSSPPQLTPRQPRLACKPPRALCFPLHHPLLDCPSAPLDQAPSFAIT